MSKMSGRGQWIVALAIFCEPAQSKRGGMPASPGARQ